MGNDCFAKLNFWHKVFKAVTTHASDHASEKIMQVGVDVTYMHTNFSGRDLSGFGDIATFKNVQISLSTHGLYIVHGHQKI